MKKRKKKPETTKLIVALILATYFVGVVFGGVMVATKATDQLYAYLAFIGTPTSAAVGFYCWKAKSENMSKYAKKAKKDEPPDIPMEIEAPGDVSAEIEEDLTGEGF